jgi:hypothetical protein
MFLEPGGEGEIEERDVLFTKQWACNYFKNYDMRANCEYRYRFVVCASKMHVHTLGRYVLRSDVKYSNLIDAFYISYSFFTSMHGRFCLWDGCTWSRAIMVETIAATKSLQQKIPAVAAGLEQSWLRPSLQQKFVQLQLMDTCFVVC